MGKRGVIKPACTMALIADLHTGSEVAVWPEHFKTSNERSVPPSDGQIKILRCFEDFVWQCDEYGVDTVVSLGDLLDGFNKAESGRHRMVADLNQQKEAALSLLEPLIKWRPRAKRADRRFGGVAGTIYHDAANGKIERELVKSLGGKWFGAIKNVKIPNTDLVLRIKHGTGGSPIYSGTAASKAINLHLLAVSKEQVPRAHLLAQGHWHHHLYLQQDDCAFLQVPCWQDYMPYTGTLGYPDNFQPTIGGVIMEFSKNAVVGHHLFKYPNPQITMKVSSFATSAVR